MLGEASPTTSTARPALGSWLLPVLLGAVAAGIGVACLEWTYIVLVCGPFWVSAAPLLTPVLIYTGVAVFGTALLGLLTYLMPPLRSRLQAPAARFGWSLALAGATAGILIVLLLFRDLDSNRGPLQLAGLLLLAAAVTTLLLLRAGHKQWGPGHRLLLSIALSTGTLLVVTLLSNWHFAKLLKQRCTAFEGDRPHVGLIVMDTARAAQFSCYGYPLPTSPRIDRLAHEGLLCANAFSASNWTTPGHISMFTGKYPPQHKNDGHAFMPDEMLSLTEVLREHGYFCLALYNNFLAGRDVNLVQGFDRSVGVFTDTWPYPAPYRLWGKLRIRDQGAAVTFAMALRACEWVRKRGGHVFLYVNVLEPHGPYEAHEPYFSELTKTIDRSKVQRYQPIERLRRGFNVMACDTTLFAGFTAEEYAYLWGFYDSEIAYLDEQIGLFADGLEERGSLDETLLVLTSDHGEFLGEHFTVGHPALLLDPVLRIPLIFRWPGGIKPAVATEPTSNVDVCPSILGLLGYARDLPADIEGMDVLTGQRSPDRRLLSARVYGSHGCYCLIEGSRKFFLNGDWRLQKHFPYEKLLFDSKVNPREEIWPESANTPEALEMERRLEEWISRILVRPETELHIDARLIERMKALGYIR